MNYQNIKTDDNGISFDSVNESRTMKKDSAVANVTFKIKGFVSFEKAIKSAIDFAIIRYRDNAVKQAKAEKMLDSAWMQQFNNKTIELDIEEILTANRRESDPVKKVAKQIKNADQDKLVARLIASGKAKNEEEAKRFISAFLES